MDLSKKIFILTFIFFHLHAFGNELSVNLQKTCISEQLSEHKTIKGHSFQAGAFIDYCKYETDFILEKASQKQLSEISKKQSTYPIWLKQLKSEALNRYVEQKPKTTV
jgi:hypothetical protein